MSELSQAIEEMRNMRESYDQIAQAAESYNTGKTELAANISAKGVQASAGETLPELAGKVAAIAQTTTEIVGGQMYGAQLFGDANPAQSPLWNLYDVLAEMKTRFMGAGQYAALIVCEYYKGYDSLQLQGADAYYTCDGDLYETSMPLHVWHDADNGRVNRWVCFLYSTAGARLDITNTAISPRSMYIGGHIGTIEYFVDGRLTDLVCGIEDTDLLDNFIGSRHTQSFQRNAVLNNVKSMEEALINNSGNVIINNLGNIYWDKVAAYILRTNAQFIRINADSITLRNTAKFIYDYSQGGVLGVEVQGVLSGNDFTYQAIFFGGSNNNNRYLQYIKAPGFIGGCALIDPGGSGKFVDLIDVEVGEVSTRLPMSAWTATNIISDADKKAQLIDNIKNHILARVSERTGLSQLTFTVATSLYNAIASENIEWQGETMSLADAFLTKNWLLAGA